MSQQSLRKRVKKNDQKSCITTKRQSSIYLSNISQALKIISNKCSLAIQILKCIKYSIKNNFNKIEEEQQTKKALSEIVLDLILDSDAHPQAKSEILSLFKEGVDITSIQSHQKRFLQASYQYSKIVYRPNYTVTSQILNSIFMNKSQRLISGYPGVSKSFSLSLIKELYDIIFSFWRIGQDLTNDIDISSKKYSRYQKINCQKQGKSRSEKFIKQFPQFKKLQKQEQEQLKHFIVKIKNQLFEEHKKLFGNKIIKPIYYTVSIDDTEKTLHKKILSQCEEDVDTIMNPFQNNNKTLKQLYQQAFQNLDVELVFFVDQINNLSNKIAIQQNMFDFYMEQKKIAQEEAKKHKKEIDTNFYQEINNKIEKKFQKSKQQIEDGKQKATVILKNLRKMVKNCHKTIYLSSINIESSMLRFLNLNDSQTKTIPIIHVKIHYLENKLTVLTDIKDFFYFQAENIFMSLINDEQEPKDLISYLKRKIEDSKQKYDIWMEKNSKHIIPFTNLIIRETLFKQIDHEKGFPRTTRRQIKNFFQNIQSILDQIKIQTQISIKLTLQEFINNNENFFQSRKDVIIRIYYSARAIIKAQQQQNEIKIPITHQDTLFLKQLTDNIDNRLFKVSFQSQNDVCIESFIPGEILLNVLSSTLQQYKKKILLDLQQWSLKLKGLSYGLFIQDIIIDMVKDKNSQWKFQNYQHFIMGQKIFTFQPLQKNTKDKKKSYDFFNGIKDYIPLVKQSRFSYLLLPIKKTHFCKAVNFIKYGFNETNNRNHCSPAIDFIIMKKKINQQGKDQLFFYLFDVTTDIKSIGNKISSFIQKFKNVKSDVQIAFNVKVYVSYSVLFTQSMREKIFEQQTQLKRKIIKKLNKISAFSFSQKSNSKLRFSVSNYSFLVDVGVGFFDQKNLVNKLFSYQDERKIIDKARQESDSLFDWS